MHKLMLSYLTVTRNSNIFVGDCEKWALMLLKKCTHTRLNFQFLNPILHPYPNT